VATLHSFPPIVWCSWPRPKGDQMVNGSGVRKGVWQRGETVWQIETLSVNGTPAQYNNHGQLFTSN